MASSWNSSIDVASTLPLQEPRDSDTINLLVVLTLLATLVVLSQFSKDIKAFVPSKIANKATNTSPRLSALNDFVFYGDSISYKACTISQNATHDAPELIVLCTWMGAAPRYIAKYTNSYMSSFPSAAQLVINSTLPDMTWRTNTSQRNRIAPAIDILISILDKNPNTRILLHIFSDGGANTACQLAHELRVRSNKPFPAAAIILDSTPGSGTYRTCRDAIVNSLPSSILVRSISVPLTHAYLVTVWNMETFFRVENVRERRRLDLNDGTLFADQAPRLYVYSKTDKIIPWKGVETHVEAATDVGLQTESLRFEGTSHVWHIQKHADEYWEAVHRVWFRRNI